MKIGKLTPQRPHVSKYVAGIGVTPGGNIKRFTND